MEVKRVAVPSHVAAYPHLVHLEGNVSAAQRFREAVNVYVNALEKLGVDKKELGNVPRRHSVFERYDGRILFENRLGDFIESESNRRLAREALSPVLKVLNVKTVNPYYVLLLADGDHMGKLIDQKTIVEDHQKLSRKLAKFASNVRTIVEQDYQGDLVYSGGDDVLAFLPLHTALECANALRQDFDSRFGKEEINDDGRILNPSLSVGMVVAHHLDPLNDTLKLVREAEKEAKKERNSLAITMAKRSGADYTIKGRWDEPINLYTRLTMFIDWYFQDSIPTGLAYELELLARVFDKKPTEETAAQRYQQALEYEVKRILGRKNAGQSNSKIPEENRNYLINPVARGASAQKIADGCQRVLY